MESITGKIDKASKLIAKSSFVVALCGAGISEESGIMTFRDTGGIWDRLDPSVVGSTRGLLRALRKNPQELIDIFIDILDSLYDADPNDGHFALSSLESFGILKTTITQNADNLHQEAGSKNLIEIHGNLFRMKCTSCRNKKLHERRELIRETKEKIKNLPDLSMQSLVSIAPQCGFCFSPMRPDVVMFGEAVHGLKDAHEVSKKSDCMLVLGTSGTVYPAALFPVEAKKSGATIISINPAEDAFSRITDIHIPMKSGAALPRIAETIQAYM